MASLRDILNAYNMNVLKVIGRELGIKPVQKAALIREIMRGISKKTYVEQATKNLQPPERQTIGLLQVAQGESYTSAIKSKLLRDGVIKDTPAGSNRYSSYKGNPNYTGKPAFEDVIAHLTKCGLVFSRNLRANQKAIDWTPGEILFIPKSLRSHFPNLASPELTSVTMTAEPAQVLAGSSRTFQRDLGRYWRYIRGKEVLRLTTQGYVYKADLKAINEMLSVPSDLGAGKGEPDNKRLYFIRRILRDLEVVKLHHDGNVYPVFDTPFWGIPAAERVKRTFNAWRDGIAWNEILNLPTKARGYRHDYGTPKELVAARQKVLNHIQQASAKRWISLRKLTGQIQLRDYGFLFPQRRYSGYDSFYYRTPSGYASRSTPYHDSCNPFGIGFDGVTNEFQGWGKVEAQFIAHIVSGPLFWMGLVDLGYPAKVQTNLQNPSLPAAFRLTPMGAWVLGLGQVVDIREEGGRVIVQPNFQILAMEPISDQVLIALDHFADVESAGDRVMSYKLTRQSVYRGQQGEWDVPRIIAHLEKVSGNPLPGNVRRSLEEWQVLHERIVFRRGITLLQAADGKILDSLLQDPNLAQVLGRRVTENATLASGTIPQAMNALHKKGWFPLTTPANRRKVPKCARADVDGRLHFIHAAPSIYALGKVAPFSELSDSQYQITEKSVQAALKHRGTTVDSILESLRSVYIGEPPRNLILDIKAWGKYYGNAKMDTLTLVQFRDKEILSELLADPDISPYLTPFKAGIRALAVVDREHIEKVQRLLADRNIKIRWKLT